MLLMKKKQLEKKDVVYYKIIIFINLTKQLPLGEKSFTYMMEIYKVLIMQTLVVVFSCMQVWACLQLRYFESIMF